MARSAVIQKTKLPSYPNSVFFPSNNEKRKTYAGRDFLKCEQFQPEHKAPKRYIEVGINDSTGNKLPISLSTAAAYIHPAAADTPRGQERCWRGIGDRNPLSLSNRPREEQIKSTGAMRYSSLEKTKTYAQSQPQLPYRFQAECGAWGGPPYPLYSLRKASTGSFLAASRAGMMPAIRVNAMLMHTRIAPPTGGRAARV